MIEEITGVKKSSLCSHVSKQLKIITLKLHMIQIKATIYFENPFWVGLFERTDKKGYAASKKLCPHLLRVKALG